MAQENRRALIRIGFAALALACAALPALAQPAAKPPASPSAQPAPPAPPPIKGGREWASLTADQQKILAPLQPEWNWMRPEQRTKWVGIAKRYPEMNAQDQKRVQARMQKWAKLTPVERQQARERYRSISKMASDRREELRRHWAEYQALPPHERRMLDVQPVEKMPRVKRSAPRKPQQSIPNSYP